MSSRLEENKAIATKFMGALSTLDVPVLLGMMAPDFRVVSTGTSVLSGTTHLADMPKLTARLNETLPNGVELTILDMIAEGDRVAVEAQGKATSAAGKPYNQQYLFIFDIKDGKVSVMTEYLDTLLINNVFT